MHRGLRITYTHMHMTWNIKKADEPRIRNRRARSETFYRKPCCTLPLCWWRRSIAPPSGSPTASSYRHGAATVPPPPPAPGASKRHSNRGQKVEVGMASKECKKHHPSPVLPNGTATGEGVQLKAQKVPARAPCATMHKCPCWVGQKGLSESEGSERIRPF